jgi:hypothetical protein
VHPTRLSKIFAAGRTHPYGNARQRQASKLAGHARRKKRMRSPKMKTFEKEPTRKAVFRSGGGPPGVLLPFLTRGSLSFIPHRPARKQARTSNTLRPSKSATPLEYQNHYRRASPVCNYFQKPAMLWDICAPVSATYAVGGGQSNLRKCRRSKRGPGRVRTIKAQVLESKKNNCSAAKTAWLSLE